jgi:hypothetical protein
VRLIRIILASGFVLLALAASPALAQNNICPNVAAGDSSNKCANTAFVQQSISPFFITCPAHQWVSQIAAALSICAQPSFTDLSGKATNGQLPVGAANTVKTSLDGVNEIDTGVPNCITTGSALQYTSGTGFSCGTGLSGRIILKAPTTFWVQPTGVDQPGCGLASGTSGCHTRGYLVFNVLAPNYDLGGQTVTVDLHTGSPITYTDSLQALIPQLVGQNGAGGLIFTGDCTAGHTNDVMIQPGAGLGYTYGFAFGFSARIQCQKLDQTTGVRAGSSNDMVVAGQGSNILLGNPSLFNVRADMTYGCNINPFNTFTVGPRGAYIQFDNDFTVDVGLCQVAVTGTPTNGSAVIGSIANTSNIVKYMGIIGTNVPTDAFVSSIVANTSVTMGCLYTSPCQASGSPGAETITFTGGGQSFIDSDSSQSFFTGNGDPSFSIIGTLANFPYYFSGWMFINDASQSNAQGITWVNPGQGRGRCSAVSGISILNTNFQGVPYFPCNALQPETSPSATVTAGSSTFTVSSAAGIVRGQIATDVVNPTATWTAGASTMVVSSATGIVAGAKVTAAGILGGAFVSNVAGTTITVSGCGSGPRCVTGSPLYLSGSATGVSFSNGLFSGSSVVTNISGTTITISDTIKNSGTAGNVWFQGRVTNGAIYD